MNIVNRTNCQNVVQGLFRWTFGKFTIILGSFGSQKPNTNNQTKPNKRIKWQIAYAMIQLSPVYLKQFAKEEMFNIP